MTSPSSAPNGSPSAKRKSSVDAQESGDDKKQGFAGAIVEGRNSPEIPSTSNTGNKGDKKSPLKGSKSMFDLSKSGEDDTAGDFGKGLGMMMTSALKGTKTLTRSAWNLAKTGGRGLASGVKKLDARVKADREDRKQRKESRDKDRVKHQQEEESKDAAFRRQQEEEDGNVRRRIAEWEAKAGTNPDLVKQKNAHQHQAEQDKRDKQDQREQREHDFRMLKIEKNAALSAKEMDAREREREREKEEREKVSKDSRDLAMRALDIDENKSKQQHQQEMAKINALKEVMLASVQAGQGIPGVPTGNMMGMLSFGSPNEPPANEPLGRIRYVPSDSDSGSDNEESGAKGGKHKKKSK